MLVGGIEENQIGGINMDSGSWSSFKLPGLMYGGYELGKIAISIPQGAHVMKIEHKNRSTPNSTMTSTSVSSRFISQSRKR